MRQDEENRLHDRRSLDRLERWALAVRDVGFPIVVSMVLLWAFVVRMPLDVAALTAAINANNSELKLIRDAQQDLLEVLRKR
jgi:hypothetical protein